MDIRPGGLMDDLSQPGSWDDGKREGNSMTQKCVTLAFENVVLLENEKQEKPKAYSSSNV